MLPIQLVFFLVPFKWVCKEYILRYAMKKNVEPQTTDLFPHFSIYEEKRMKKKSFQNVQCRFASFLRFYIFSVLPNYPDLQIAYVIHISMHYPKYFRCFLSLSLFSYSTSFWPTCLHRKYRYVVPFSFIFFFAPQMFICYVCIFVQFPFISFDCVQFMEAASSTATVAITIARITNILRLHWKIHFV